MIKRKFYLEKIVKLIDTEDIKVITGVRRCGKTVLLKQIIDELENRGIASENIIYMSFESSKYKNIRNDDDLDEFIFSKTNNLNGKIYLLFDERHHQKTIALTHFLPTCGMIYYTLNCYKPLFRAYSFYEDLQELLIERQFFPYKLYFNRLKISCITHH